MVGYYRLRELGFRLSAGAHVLPKAMFAPVEASTELLEEARRAAEAIVAQARDAFEAEKRRGFEEGMALARIESAERLLRESGMLDAKLAGLEAGLADIVVSGVRRLIASFDDRAKAEEMVRTALKQMRREKKAELRVSPAQYEDMRAAIGGIVRDFPEIDLVDVVEDGTLVAPQIIVETSIGRVEGDLGRSLDELERAIRAVALGGAQAPASIAAASAPILLEAVS